MAEAGWFNDLQNPRLARWFDGEEWTEHTIVKTEWAGPGSPPPPAGPPSTTLEWDPPFDDPPPIEDPRPEPMGQLVSTRDHPARHQPSNIAKVTRRYRKWPLWARIAAPAAVVILLFAAVTLAGGDDTPDQVDTTATTVSVDDAVRIALTELGSGAAPIIVRQVIESICANEAEAAAIAASGASDDPQAVANLIGAAAEGATERCPRVTENNPTLLNRIQGRAQVLLGATTSSSELTTTTTTAAASATTATTKQTTTTTAKATTTTAKATTTTQPTTTTPTEPDPDYVTPGDPCSPAGAAGYSSDGTPMTCTAQTCDGQVIDQPYWRAAC